MKSPIFPMARISPKSPSTERFATTPSRIAGRSAIVSANTFRPERKTLRPQRARRRENNMTKEMTDGLEEAFKTGRVYDFIAKNNWRMTKDELKDILLEIVDAETHGMNSKEA